MKHEILHGPAYALLKIMLGHGEQVVAESGAMVSMSDTISIDTKAKGGLMQSLGRSLLGGESFFLNTFTASADGEITLAPKLPGHIYAMQVSSDKVIFVQSGSYLASTPGVEVSTKWGGAKTFFSREGFFLLKITGSGVLWMSSYGAIYELQLGPGQVYKVDTGHMVSFDETVQYKVVRVGGWKSTLLSGEGLVCELTGPGRITLQTRSEQDLLSWLIPRLPHKRE